MTTFTLQDLNLPATAEEAIKAVEMGELLPNPTTVISSSDNQNQPDTTPPEGESDASN